MAIVKLLSILFFFIFVTSCNKNEQPVQNIKKTFNNHYRNFLNPKKIILNHDLPESSSVLILGYSFKENCSDFRNTKVAKVSNYLGKHFLVDIHDPLIDLEEAKKNKSCNFELRNEKYDIILLLVPHLLFNINYVMNFAHDKSIVFDFKNVLPKSNNIPIYTL